MREIGWLILGIWVVQLVVIIWKSTIFRFMMIIVLGFSLGVILWFILALFFGVLI